MAAMDPIIAALFGYGLNKALDGLFAIGGQRRALKNALGRALTRFRDHYPEVMDLILADEPWELFQEELKLLVTADQHPDATRLAFFLHEFLPHRLTRKNLTCAESGISLFLKKTNRSKQSYLGSSLPLLRPAPLPCDLKTWKGLKSDRRPAGPGIGGPPGSAVIG
jgi:hypothetical protein